MESVVFTAPAMPLAHHGRIGHRADCHLLQCRLRFCPRSPRLVAECLVHAGRERRRHAALLWILAHHRGPIGPGTARPIVAISAAYSEGCRRTEAAPNDHRTQDCCSAHATSLLVIKQARCALQTRPSSLSAATAASVPQWPASRKGQKESHPRTCRETQMIY
jgi:hypothetical protein